MAAAVPAAAPTATASVGEVLNRTTASVASATPTKSAGKTGPPRKPAPRLIAYASPFATSRMSTTATELWATNGPIEFWPENKTSCEFAPSASAARARPPTASAPASSNAAVRPSAAPATRVAIQRINAMSTPAAMPTTMPSTRSSRWVPT